MPSKRMAIGAAMLGLAAATPMVVRRGEAPWAGWSSTVVAAHVGAAASQVGAATLQEAVAPTTAGAPIQSNNPFSFPLDNGFLTLSDDAKNTVNVLVHGTEPSGPPPTLKADDLISFQLIAFNEIFEVAFFTDLLFNVTNSVPGFEVTDQNERQTLINALVAIQATEELHADNANAVLSNNKVAPIQPCKYQFPTTNLMDALNLAATFTDVVLATLQDIQLHLAQDNADDGPAVVPIIGSVIGNEGEQTGFFRNDIGKIPTGKPFLTRASRKFAFSALNQMFVANGSCPNSNRINLPVFLPLTIEHTQIQPKDQLITFSVTVEKPSPPMGLSLALINGQNVPIVEKVQSAVVKNGVATFQANFPFTEHIMDGLTIAALTNSAGPFADAEAVTNATIAGPGLIEVD